MIDRKQTLTLLAAAVAAAVLFAACEGKPTPPPATPPAAQQQQQSPPGSPDATGVPPQFKNPGGAPPIDPAQAQSGQLPPGHPPIGGAAGSQIVPPPEGSGTGEKGMTWTVPQGWIVETPTSAMRRAQYRAKGKAGDGECVVFYFGPNQGGTPEQNADRWVSQFTGPGGKPAKGTGSKQMVGGIPVLLVEVTGTYAGGMPMAGAPAQEIPNAMLLGAIAEGPDANWFFKFTGPEATIREQRAAFEGMVKSLRKGA